ncbi:hypothetical protein HN51_047396 [Arachis hypogaea]
MRFDFAIESQRHKKLADNVTLHPKPELKLHKNIEKHKLKRQKSMKSLFFVLEIIVDNGSKVSKNRKVTYYPSNHVAHCLCTMFEAEEKLQLVINGGLEIEP